VERRRHRHHGNYDTVADDDFSDDVGAAGSLEMRCEWEMRGLVFARGSDKHRFLSDEYCKRATDGRTVRPLPDANAI
jgi:hypothetical protein